MPVTLLATSLERNGKSDIKSANQLGEYLAHGKYFTDPDNTSTHNIIEFAEDSCTFRNDCTFVPPLNVLVTLKSTDPSPVTTCTLQFNRMEYITSSSVTKIKMYVDKSVAGLTSIDTSFNIRQQWHQYLKRTSDGFDTARPFWKDRNTKFSEFLESHRERKHICTLTNDTNSNFTWNAFYNGDDIDADDHLPNNPSGWTTFKHWKLLDGDNPIHGDGNALIIQEAGTYELHFNIYFIAVNFEFSDFRFTSNEQLKTAISQYFSSDSGVRAAAGEQYGHISEWTFSNTLTDFSEVFKQCDFSQFGGEFPDISGWDVSSVENMSSMFEDCSSFNQDIKTNGTFWDVSTVTNMSSMFKGCTTFDQDISTWNVSNVTDMSSMFEDCSSFRQNSIKTWIVTTCSNFTNMFKNSGAWPMDSVIEINSAWGSNVHWSRSIADMEIGPFQTRLQLLTAIHAWNYNSPRSATDILYGTIDSWEFASSLTDFSNLFDADTSHSNSSFNANISNWNVSSVTDMSSMFNGCSSFNQDISNWNVSTVTDMSSMFKGCTTFDQDISSWNVSNVTDMSSMFEDCSSFRQNSIKTWIVTTCSNFTNMFKNSGAWPMDSVIEINSAWGSNVHWSRSIADMEIGPFQTRLQLLTAIHAWNYNSPRSATDILYGTIDSWEFASSLTDFSNLFDADTSHSNSSFNANISNWNVSSVTDMSSMFNGCSSFNQDISSWVVSSVTNMSSMFKGCSSFNQDIKTNGTFWVVSSVTDMSSMFNGCSSFNQDISNWNVSSVTDMTSMFEGCNSMTHLDISDWDVSSVADTSSTEKELYSVDFRAPASQDYNPGSSPNSSWSTLEYLLEEGDYYASNNWNRVVHPATAPSFGTWVNNTLTADNLQDGVSSIISDIGFTVNLSGKYYRHYSATQHVNNFYSVASDIIVVKPYFNTVSNTASNTGDSQYYNLPFPFKFTNVPRGLYTLRIFSQVTGNGANTPNHTKHTLTDGTNRTESTQAGKAYATFYNLTANSSNEIGWEASYDNTGKNTVFGGVQLQRDYTVSKFKDMFKGSAWQDSNNAAVRTAINDEWKNDNVRWYKNEAKLF